MFVDELTEVLGGTVSDYHYVLNNMTYKEAVSYRDTRLKRKIKEYEEEEERRKKEYEKQQREIARNKIMR